MPTIANIPKMTLRGPEFERTLSRDVTILSQVTSVTTSVHTPSAALSAVASQSAYSIGQVAIAGDLEMRRLTPGIDGSTEPRRQIQLGARGKDGVTG